MNQASDSVDAGVLVQTIYTFGYSGRTVRQLEEAIQRLDGYVIDTRLSPGSRVADWNRANLERTIKRYMWVKEFGNLNYRSDGGPILIANYELGTRRVADVASSGYALILLCACADVAVCHRRVVAEKLAGDMAWKVEHLVKGVKTPSAQQGLFG